LEGDQTVGWVPCSRESLANGRNQLPIIIDRIDGQPSAARCVSRSVLKLLMTVDDMEVFSLMTAFAAQNQLNGAKPSCEPLRSQLLLL